MGIVGKLADGLERGLAAALPGLRKTVVGEPPLAVGAMIEGRTPNTAEPVDLLPLKTKQKSPHRAGFGTRLDCVGWIYGGCLNHI